MKVKENPIFLPKTKKIQLIKNINVNLKCIKAQKLKFNNGINSSSKNKIFNSNYIICNNNFSKKKNINYNEKKTNIVIKKINNTNKINQKRSKSTKSLSVNNSNKNNLRHNFHKIKNTQQIINNKSFIKSSINTLNKKGEFYKKININKNNNNNKIRKNNHSLLSTIERPKKRKKNNVEITPNNPMEITFGSSSFMSNNIQTETNETDKEKPCIKINKQYKKKNNSFIKSINSKKDLKSKNKFRIEQIKLNKISKLNKKLLLRPTWKIKPRLIKYKPLKPYCKNEKEKIKEEKINKSAFIIDNYKKKAKYIIHKKIDSSHYLNNIANINNSKSFVKDNKNNKRNLKLNYQDKNLRTQTINFYNKNLLKNKLFKKKNEVKERNNFDTKKGVIKNYSLNDTFFNKSNIINRNINNTNKNFYKDKFNETKECIIKINKSVDKENGKFKLIIKKTNKVIKRMPKSTPKLLLTHPSFKNLFF